VSYLISLFCCTCPC